MSDAPRIPASFRDPSGFLFVHDGVVHRHVNPVYAPSYDALMASGLYPNLTDAGLMVSHEEVDLRLPESGPAHRVLRPVQIPFVSHPYEWCFGQLKTAALLTLEVQKHALAHGMVLRDASAYNVQIVNGRAVFIDTLSFGRYVEGEPWVAYQQFCKHFLAPLVLMANADVGLGQLLRVWIDGIPLDLASKLLPFSTKFSFPLLTHIHLHARSSKKYAAAGASGEAPVKKGTSAFTKAAMLGLVDSLESAVNSLDWNPKGTEWGDYYDKTNYTAEAHELKKQLVGRFLKMAGARGLVGSVWDFGANTGMFSRIAADAGARVVSFDVDPAAVERHWREVEKQKETRILPLVQDLTNPSADIGWDNTERRSLVARGPADVALALALVHHLAISNNIPLTRAALFLRRVCRFLLIEFVPKRDSQVKRLLATREDIFSDYTEEGFERAFSASFTILAREPVHGSQRTLYLMEGR